MDKNPGAKVPMRRHVRQEADRDKSFDLFDPTDKVAKLIRMLGNGASDAEIIGAARALDRTLEGAGGLHHLADVVEAHWRPPQPEPPPREAWSWRAKPPPPAPKFEWQAEASRLLQYPQFLIREYPDEIDFLTNVSKMRSCPSESQWRWMCDIQHAVDQRIPPEMRKRRRRAA
jgi:hypothetical protein